ncbi:DUF4175 family protein [bacterium]|nr:DUF4175 family protein [Candidatus Omnitrophota bacterium]MBU3929144.1 DUF4175 family protein [bacterium]MBU4123043.1 DUF4175 family protein [bacterium]
MINDDFLRRLGVLHGVRVMAALANCLLIRLASFAAGFAVFSLADLVFPMSFRIRSFVLIFFGVYFMVRLSTGLIEIFSSAREKSARAAGDDVLRAWDLSVSREKLSGLGISRELIDEEIKTAAKIVKDIRLLSFVSLNPKAVLAMIAAGSVLFFNSVSARRVIVPRGDDIKSYLSVEMEKTAVKGEPWELIARATPGARPRAMFLFPSSTWVERKLGGCEGLFSFRIEKCLVPFKIRFRWKNIYSEVYDIKLLERPRVLWRKIKINYPAYLNLPEDESSFGGFAAFPGTVAELIIKSSQKLESASITAVFEGKEKKIKMAVSGDQAKGSFTASGAGHWKVELLSRDGLVSSGTVVWKVDAAEDSPPSAYILSPGEDLIINESFSGIDIAWLAEDDFGVKEVMFYSSKNGGPPVKTMIFNSYAKTSRGKWDWKLSQVMAAADVMEYWIAALDASGARGESRRFTVTLKDFLHTHRENMRGEEALKENIFALYQKQAELNINREALSADEIARRQREVENKLLSLSEEAALTAARAEKDPLYSSYYSAEYRGLSKALDGLAADARRAQDELKAGDKKGAFDTQDDIAESLEKLSAFSEELFKRSSMDNMGNIARESSEVADKLNDFLGSSAPDEEMLKELRSLTEKIGQLMRELAETVKNMPQNLPEEFVNSDSVKSMDFNSVENSVSGLKEALSSGDITSAVEHAKALLKSLSGIRKNLEAGFSSVEAPSLPRKEKDTALAEIISGEEKIIASSEALLARGRDRLKEISARRARELRGRADGVKNSAARLLNDRNKLFAKEAARLSQGLYNFNRNVSDFAERFMDKGFDFERPLEDAQKQLRALAAMDISSSTANILSEARDEIRDFFDIYSDTAARTLNQDEMEYAMEISSAQTALAGRAAALEKKMREYSRQSAQFPSAIAGNVRAARREMISAASSLKAGLPADSLAFQERALYQLKKAQKGMDDFEFNPQSEPGGSSMPSFFPSSGGKGDSPGQSSPGAGFKQYDFNIPRSLRPGYDAEGEIINDAMRGERPLKYQDMLKEYYEQLLK